MNEKTRWSIFEAFGIELEYMLVDDHSLDVKAVADRLIETAAGKLLSDLEIGPITWSNELALHVIELKGTMPSADLVALADSMQNAIRELQPALAANSICLLPTGMHPWMNPATETRLWPHEYAEIYQAYHDVFDCFRHGWSNVQSVHLNLPFETDDEFARLHAAVRLLLPLLPALSASSPIMDRRLGDWSDMRMQMVRTASQRVPFLSGQMIPEPIFDEATYRQQIFGGLEEAIAPFDSAGVFDPNFLNSRGAIARFDRGSIEIRVMDVQEFPRADIAICVASIGVLKALVAGHWKSLESQKRVGTESLSNLLNSVSQQAEKTVIEDQQFLQQFSIDSNSISAGELWSHLLEVAEQYEPMVASFKPELDYIANHGSLATRIQRAVAGDLSQERLTKVYRRLSHCLLEGESFS